MKLAPFYLMPYDATADESIGMGSDVYRVLSPLAFGLMLQTW